MISQKQKYRLGKVMGRIINYHFCLALTHGYDIMLLKKWERAYGIVIRFSDSWISSSGKGRGLFVDGSSGIAKFLKSGLNSHVMI